MERIQASTRDGERKIYAHIDEVELRMVGGQASGQKSFGYGHCRHNYHHRRSKTRSYAHHYHGGKHTLQRSDDGKRCRTIEA